MTIQLYNTLTRKKEEFKPLDETNVRMYVCGPTVYDRAHLGNARSVVVYDVLYRLLRHLYPKVTYVRNITDVDDKINKAAKEQGIPIQQLTGKVTGWFHEDMAALNVLPPTIEPKATEHIGQMIEMIKLLIENGKAYVTNSSVLFSVKSMKNYGALSGRVQEELDAGARVKIAIYKRDPNDFILWKPADADDDKSSVFDSPWGKGRPGWHIECSAMSTEYLGQDFDIHGGGSDLMFPHHENEIAQSCGAYPHSHFAKYWVHNGFLTVNGEKMSKSLGNFITVRDLLDKAENSVEARKIGEIVRFALLSTKYNEPLDWNNKLFEDSKKNLNYFYGLINRADLVAGEQEYLQGEDVINRLAEVLKDDLNAPKVLGSLYASGQNSYHSENNSLNKIGYVLKRFMNEYLGLLNLSSEEWFRSGLVDDDNSIQHLISARITAKKAKNWAEADRIRGELKAQGIILEDRPDGTTDWRRE